MVPKDKWVWCGYPGHFVGGANCRFHLSTRIGKYRVSTVGDYHPPSSTERETIGAGPDSFYETHVFRVEGRGEHGEGVVSDWSEIDSERWADDVAAEKGHMTYCRKYARRKS